MTKCLAQGHTHHNPRPDSNPRPVELTADHEFNAPDHEATALHSGALGDPQTLCRLFRGFVFMFQSNHVCFVSASYVIAEWSAVASWSGALNSWSAGNSAGRGFESDLGFWYVCPWARHFVTHCFSPPRSVNGYRH